MQYFRFLRIVICSNFLMTIWFFIGWIPHVQTTRPLIEKEGMSSDSGTLSDMTELLFLSTYQPSSDNVWVAMAVLGTITMMLSAPIHAVIHYRHEKKKDRSHTHSSESDEIPYPPSSIQSVGSTSRLIISYIFLMIVCLVPIGINYGLLYVANHRALKVRKEFFSRELTLEQHLQISSQPWLGKEHDLMVQANYESVAGKYPSSRGEQAGGLNGSALAAVVSIFTTVFNLIFETIAGFIVDYQRNKYYSVRRSNSVHRLIPRHDSWHLPYAVWDLPFTFVSRS